MKWARRLWNRIDELIPVRYWLAIWAFLGSTNIYAMRVNLNVAIVAMVKDRRRLYNLTSSSSGDDDVYCTESFLSNSTGRKYSNVGEFDWDEKTQGLILSAFFWGYLFTQLPGGRWSEIFSGKWLFGIGVFTTAFFTLLTPLAARLGVWWLIAVRVVEGLFEGVTYPAIYSLFAKWSPPMERTQLYAFIHLGVCIGTIIASPVSGILIELPIDNGWPLVFYFFGAVGVIWFIFWCFFVYESPDLHPRISVEERDYILSSLNKTIEMNKKKAALPVPWKAIFTSTPFWGIVCGHLGFYWGFNTLITQLPTYLKSVLRYDMKASAFLSALPYIGKTVLTMVIGYGADFCRRRKILSTCNVRRISNSIGNFLPAIAFVIIPLVGCDKTAALWLLVCAASCHSGCSSGFFTSHVDLAPNFTGTLMGITNTIATLASISAPYFAGAITNNNSTIYTWSAVFYTAAAVQTVANILYCILIKGEEQPWNNPITEEAKNPSTDGLLAKKTIASSQV